MISFEQGELNPSIVCFPKIVLSPSPINPGSIAKMVSPPGLRVGKEISFPVEQLASENKFIVAEATVFEAKIFGSNKLFGLGPGMLSEIEVSKL